MNNVNGEQVVSGVAAALEKAWNEGDGAAFAGPFANDADFVNIRGQHFQGREVIARGHQHIFDTSYKGSTIHVQVAQVRSIAPDVLLAHVKSALKAPAGPLAGGQTTFFTMVIVRGEAGWRIAAFHNTLVM